MVVNGEMPGDRVAKTGISMMGLMVPAVIFGVPLDLAWMWVPGVVSGVVGVVVFTRWALRKRSMKMKTESAKRDGRGPDTDCKGRLRAPAPVQQRTMWT